MKKLISRTKFTIQAKDKSKAMNLIVNENIACSDSKVNENRELEIFITGKQNKDIERLFVNNGIEAKIEEIPGMLKALDRLKHRWGIIIGAILSLIILIASSKFIWKIDVEGNHALSDSEIISELEKAGLSLGTYIPKIDYDSLHNKILLNSKMLSWVSVNINGTVATVKVKEKQRGEEQGAPVYTNVVAKSDGYIETVLVEDGKKMVSIGQVVKKGDILISGVINSQSQGVRYEHAKGQVLAYVNKDINIKVPFKETVKIYTGKIISNKSYKIYNFPLKFLIKYRNPDGFYDTIEKKEKLSLLGISNIPVEITTTTYYEYNFEDVCYTKSQATDKAFAELRKQMDIQLKDSELISKKVNMYFDGEYFYLDCELYCLEDIAVERAFFLTE